MTKAKRGKAYTREAVHIFRGGSIRSVDRVVATNDLKNGERRRTSEGEPRFRTTAGRLAYLGRKKKSLLTDEGGGEIPVREARAWKKRHLPLCSQRDARGDPNSLKKGNPHSAFLRGRAEDIKNYIRRTARRASDRDG